MSKSFPLVTLVIVNYNGKDYIDRCCKSLFDLDYPQDKLEFIVVDNGSTDGSLENVAEKYKNIEIIKNDKNNYCKANNLAIKKAKGKYIALLNNDIKLDKNWLVKLVEKMQQDKTVGCAGGKNLFFDGKINSTGHSSLPQFYWSDRGFMEEDNGQYDKLEEVESLSHCACLYRKECLDDVGLLDEDFVMYIEDIDMAQRLKQKGFKLLYVPEAICWHRFQGFGDKGLTRYFCERNRLIFIAKYFPSTLAESLFGKGYFTVVSGQKENKTIYDVIPDALKKLYTHHDQQLVVDILPQIFENIKKIATVEKQHLIQLENDLNKAIAKKDNDFKEKDSQILEKDKQISEKDELIRSLDSQLRESFLEIKKREHLIEQKTKDIDERERYIKERDKSINERDAIIQERDKIIQHRDNIIKDKDNKIKEYDNEANNLKIQIQEKTKENISLQNIVRDNEQIIRDKNDIIDTKEAQINGLDSEIKRLENTIYEIRNCETYRYVMRPVIFIITVVKKIISKITFKKRNKNVGENKICMAYFNAKDIAAKYRKNNQYILKLTNDLFDDFFCRVKIEIKHEQESYGFFVGELQLLAKTSQEIIITTDWNNNASFFNDKEIKPQEIWAKKLDQSRYYNINATVEDKNGNIIDSLSIFQKIEK